jgi:hypothetical protein
MRLEDGLPGQNWKTHPEARTAIRTARWTDRTARAAMGASRPRASLGCGARRSRTEARLGSDTNAGRPARACRLAAAQRTRRACSRPQRRPAAGRIAVEQCLVEAPPQPTSRPLRGVPASTRGRPAPPARIAQPVRERLAQRALRWPDAGQAGAGSTSRPSGSREAALPSARAGPGVATGSGVPERLRALPSPRRRWRGASRRRSAAGLRIV